MTISPNTIVAIARVTGEAQNQSATLDPQELNYFCDYLATHFAQVKDDLNAKRKSKSSAKRKRKDNCPYCGSRDVIMFDADNDTCQKCKKWFPGT